MDVRSGVTSSTPDRVVIDAGAVYLNYGLGNQRLLGATRGGNEFNLNRIGRNIEVDGPKGPVKGMERVTEVGPQITANLIELSVENLIAAIAGANQSDRGYIELEHIGGAVETEFDLLQNDAVENSEVVYAKNADGAVTTLVKQTRSKKYASRFIGTYAANNKGFVDGIGDWVNAAGNGTLVLSIGGLSGNCLKWTGAASVTTTFLTLAGEDGAVLTNLVVDEYYRLQIAVKGDDDWDTGGALTVRCAGAIAGATGEIAITDPDDTGWRKYVIVFKATGTDATITIVSAVEETSGTIYIDSLELEKVDYPTAAQIALGQIGYVMNWGDNANAKASVIFMAVMAAADEVVVNYAYELATPGTHTTITGGDIADADYIENVAIVGNVSGTTNPVICIVKNVIANTGFSLATAPRDEAVPSIVFTGHYLPDDLDTEPWEVRWPNS